MRFVAHIRRLYRGGIGASMWILLLVIDSSSESSVSESSSSLTMGMDDCGFGSGVLHNCCCAGFISCMRTRWCLSGGAVVFSVHAAAVSNTLRNRCTASTCVGGAFFGVSCMADCNSRVAL
eukprot:6467884-Ditylum_brightwellii.AAC.1